MRIKKFKRHKNRVFRDQDIRLSKLSQPSDPLEKLNKGINFELFRGILEEKLSKLPKAPGSRPPCDYVSMFKILILQRYCHLSDGQVEFQINDRMSFMHFLDLTISGDVPDNKMVWSFREQITDCSLEKDLFDLFLRELERLNPVVSEGKIIDAGFIEVPRQRNTREQTNEIKQGEVPEEFEQNPHKLSQEDTGAHRAKKNSQTFFGYKNHVKQDAKNKLITKYTVTDAGVYVSNATAPLLDGKDKGKCFYAESAYTGEPQEKIIESRKKKNRVCEKGYKNKPLTDEQKAGNGEKSRIRSRVEHIFGFMENSMNKMYIQCIGIKRAGTVMGLMNLTYNMFCKIQLDAL
ncbi:MAG: IS5 family transposase [Tannerella sp.]|nr:IS5 family transposase [Tannerella sp.]